MAHNTLLFLESTPRHLAHAVKKVLADEEFEQVSGASKALKLLEADPEQVRLFVISKNLQWVVLGLYASHFDLTLAKAIADQSANQGWLLKKGSGSAKNEIYQIRDGQADNEPQLMSDKKMSDFLQANGVVKKMIDFKVKDHLLRENIKAGRHEDIVLGFKEVAAETRSEVEQALGTSQDLPPKESQDYSLDEFLAHAIGHKKVRAIAIAQIMEQLKRDGFLDELVISNPEPQGHYCEAFDAESYSFTSNGPYVWLEWSCEEACEPELSAETAFPSCDLKFRLEKSAEV